ncbi:MAG: sulfate adenylyltransferase [Parcubacteria group bacterium CG08_land_8_20_14_0_20_48_21]|nr:MAG: sulfate adenylyltransferase [Parcubacteria group bacterium CG08_land_8_20_14_0_20_48_21]PIW79560.1 MAG: sulfate adenylyltransferase [Parcubacteria group bacterium CG_4_8_14_3_um_filter_48_16]PIZ77858.1 MAG: sulfate adenylyltransferase [bacterium CG_4_10_14_0_2_um_filter_48_144]PJE52735.1 MAG: sulfate adenylyltransferase [Parcubacteria group bacterium CG11_big_fil_rev_8_21_14_0_20_48_46]
MNNRDAQNIFGRYPRLLVTDDVLQDAAHIVEGSYAPLTGFLRERDYLFVLDSMRLANGAVWSLPTVIALTDTEREYLAAASAVEVVNRQGDARAIVQDIEIYPYDRGKQALAVFGTTDMRHPGVARLYQQGNWLLGGVVATVEQHKKPFAALAYTPEQMKQLFAERGWKTIAAFQTRNVPHRSHEYLQRKALEVVDGLLVHPVVGKKKTGDFTDEAIVGGYELLLTNHYTPRTTVLGVLPLSMHYAGPREAVHHALIRRNFGCTHMIIGRDHAGVGSFYDPYAAHRIFERFTPQELGIGILAYENVHHCRSCNDLVYGETCGHGPGNREFLSGTAMREMVQNKQRIPEKFIRAEIAEYLLRHENPFVL